MSEEKQYYFVDESGDATFYNKKRKLTLSKNGCSPILILGLIKTDKPSELRSKVNGLRKMLQEDSFYHEIPSFKKTIRAFHAKDDVPEIRKQVYDLLSTLDFKAEFVVARKLEKIFLSRHRQDQNNFYFDLVSKLFENKLHKADKNFICFSKKDNQIKQNRFEKAVELAKLSFQNRYEIEINNKIEILVHAPGHESCLQIIDYMNWAVYRAFVSREMRYFNKVKDKVSLLIDIYDFDKYPKSYYHKKNPFHYEKITPLDCWSYLNKLKDLRS